jgi:hypothetical protein
MQCPKGCGEMKLYEDGFMKRKYICTNSSCNMKLEVNTETGEVIQVASGIAILGTAALAIGSWFFGGSGDGGSA